VNKIHRHSGRLTQIPTRQIALDPDFITICQRTREIPKKRDLFCVYRPTKDISIRKISKIPKITPNRPATTHRSDCFPSHCCSCLTNTKLATLPQNYTAFPRGTSQTARIPVFISQITRVFP